MFKTPLQSLLGCLKALQWNFHNSHWQVQGDSFYGDHLLFQRLYEGINEELDDLGEILVGYLGPEAVDLCTQVVETASWLEEWLEIECLYKRALKSELDLRDLICQVYEEIEESDQMTYGIDDFLMSLYNKHDKNVYLLKQRCRNHTMMMKKMASDSGAGSDENKFFDNPQKRSVRELRESGQETNITPEAQAQGAPKTPEDIKNEPNGEHFSTLHRFVKETEQPGAEHVGHKGKEQHPKLASWNFCKPDVYTFLGE